MGHYWNEFFKKKKKFNGLQENVTMSKVQNGKKITKMVQISEF